MDPQSQQPNSFDPNRSPNSAVPTPQPSVGGNFPAPTGYSYSSSVGGFTPDANAPTTAQLPGSDVNSGSIGRRNRTTLLSLGSTMLILGGLLVIAMVAGLYLLLRPSSNITTITPEKARNFNVIQIPLEELVKDGQVSVTSNQQLAVNGLLNVNNSLVLTPSSQPASGIPGQLYYNNTTNQLSYYNGSSFINISDASGATYLVGLAGTVPVGAGLGSAGGSLVNTGVLSLNGLAGALNVAAGSGVTITPSGSSTLTISSTGSNVAGVSSVNGLAGSLSVANASASGSIITLDTASSSQLGLVRGDGSTVNINGSGILSIGQNVSTSATPTFASLALSTPLPVSSGGTGLNNVASGGVLIGNGVGALTVATAGSNGLCFMSTGSGPVFQSCPSGGNISQGTQLGETQTTGRVAIYGAIGNTITNSILEQSGGAITSYGNFTVNVGSQFNGSGAGLTNVDADTLQGLAASAFAASGANSDITSLSGLTTALSVAQGGTGANTSQGAIDNISQLTTMGDLLYFNGTNSTRLARGTNGDCLTSNATTLVWVDCATAAGASGGANTSLSNLTGVAINTSLLTGAANIDLGSDANSFRDLYLSNGITLEGSTADNFETTLVVIDPSADRTITFPNLTGTVCLTTGNCAGVGGTGDVVNNGQNGTVRVGSNNANSVVLESNNVDRLTIDSSGAATFANSLTVTGATTLNGGLTIEAGDTFTFGGDAFDELVGTGLQISGGDLQTTLGTSVDLATAEVTGILPIANGGTNANNAASARTNLGAAASGANSDINSLTGLTNITPSSTLTVGANTQNLILQGGAGTTLSATDTGITNSLVFATPTTSGKTIIIPDASGTICLQNSGNCGFASVGSGVTSIDSTTGAFTLGTGISRSGQVLSNSGVTSAIGTLNQINVSAATGAVTFSLPQSIATTSDVQFNNIQADGNVTIGNVNTDRLTITSQILGGSPIVLQGVTDNAFATTLAVTDPTASRTITLPNASGTVAVSASGNIALSGAGDITFTGTLGVGSGGTGISAAPTNGQLLIGNGTNFTLATLTSGSGVSISNGVGSIQISAPTAGTCSTCANQALSNLNVTSINTSLIPDSNSIHDLGSSAFTWQKGYFGASIETPQVQTADTNSPSANSSDVTIRSGNAAGTTSNSGNIYIDSGTATGLAGSINIGLGAYSHNTNVGSYTGTSTLVLQSGTGGTHLSSTGSTNAFKVTKILGGNIINVDSSTTNNLITGSDFENGGSLLWFAKGPGSTSISPSTAQQWQGNTSTQAATTAPANLGMYYAYTFSPTTQYTFSFYAKVASGSISDINVGRQETGSDLDCLTGQTFTTNWTRFSCTFTTGGTISSGPNIYLKKTSGNAETFYVDGVQLETGAVATPYDPGGKLQLSGVVNSPIAFQNKSNSQDAFLIQNTAGSNVFKVDTVNNRFGTVQGGILDLDIGNASGSNSIIQYTGSALQLGAYGSGDAIQLQGDSLVFQDTTGLNDNLTITNIGAATFKNRVNSTTALQVKNAAGTDIFVVDTTNAKVGTANQAAVSTNSSALTIKSGDASGTTSNSGTVTIDSGTATGTAGNINIGTGSYAHNVNIGNSTSTSGVSIATGTSGINVDNSGATVFSIANGGGALFKNQTNSAAAFQIQNAASQSLFGVDSATNNISLFSSNSGQLNTWIGSTSMTTERRTHTSVVANGYVYAIGGVNAASSPLATTERAKINADGTLDSWTTVGMTNLTGNRSSHSSVVANGYIYVIGGTSGTTVATTERAKINADGSLGSWTTAGMTSMNTARDRHTSVVANGYVYAIGGSNGAGTPVATTERAKLNADGTLGSWTTVGMTSMNSSRYSPTSVVANGYVYAIGGYNGTIFLNTTERAKLNADGTLGSWTTVGMTNLISARDNHTSVVANGYVYAIGGYDGFTVNSAERAKLNADGTLGSWSSTTSTSTARYTATSVVVNGYVYAIGGRNAGPAVATTEYTSTQRVQVSASLDLVGLTGANLADGETGTGGTLTAGNTNIVGSLQVQGAAAFVQGLTVDKELVARGTTLFQNASNSTTALQIQDSSGVNLLTADTTNLRISIGAIGTATGQLYVGGAVPSTHAGTVNTNAANDGPSSIAVQGRYAFVLNNSTATLRSFDVSNPASPVDLGNSVGTSPSPKEVAVSGRYAYIVDTNELKIVDISNPTSMASMGGFTPTGGGNLTSVAVRGKYAYVTDDTNLLLRIVDISNPNHPYEVGNVSTISFSPIDIAVDGKYAYIVFSSASVMRKFDISNPSSPTSVGSVATTNAARSVAIQGRYAYVGVWTSNTLEIFDISPNTPTSVGSVGVGTQPNSIKVSGRYAYLINSGSDSMQIVNISNPAAPSVISGTTTTNTTPAAMAVSGRYAYIVNSGTNPDTLRTYDLGGVYVQQLEAGDIETGSITTRNDVSVGNNVDVRGGLTVGGSTSLNSLGVSGPALFGNSTDSNSAFQIQNATGTSLFIADTTNMIIRPGQNVSTTSFTRAAVDVDTSGNVGEFTSMAIGVDGMPIISYYDAGNNGGDIKIAHCTTASCSSSTNTNIDASANDYGRYTAIAIGKDGLPIISYQYFNQNDLRVTKCGNITCTSGNVSTTVDQQGALNVGARSSIAIGADGNPIIAHFEDTNNYLRVTKCSNPSCTSGTSQNVDTTGDVGYYISIKVAPDGLPVISYYDQGNTALKLAKCGNSDCSSGNTLTTVDNAADVGQFNSLAIGKDGLPVISYYDSTPNGDLKVAKCHNATCSSSTNSSVYTTNGVGQHSSLAIGSDGNPVISFYDSQDLRLVKCADASCTPASISTTLIDNTANDIGLWTSIAIGTDGNPIISHRDNNGAAQNLRAVKCGDPACGASGTTYTGGVTLGSASSSFQSIYFDTLNLGREGARVSLDQNGVFTANGLTTKADGTALLNLANSSTAFQIQNASGVTLWTADTSSLIIKVAGTSSVFATLQLDNAHIRSTQTTDPTVTSGPTNCGTATAAITANSTDAAGSFYIDVTNATGATTACTITISFNKNYGVAPKIVLTNNNTLGGTTPTTPLFGIVTASAVGSYSINLSAAPGVARYGYNYFVIEND